LDWRVGEDVITDALSRTDSAYEVQQAAANIYSRGWDALTFIAELKESIALFQGGLKKLIELLTKPGSWDELWLEWRYGWRLLYYDMKDIAQLLSNLDESKLRFRDHVTTKSTYALEEERVLSETGLYTLTMLKHIEVEISTRGSVVADIQPPKIRFDPLTTAWELITLSFIVDWFFHVGTWLSAMNFLTLNSGYVAAGGKYIKISKTLSSSVDWVSGVSGERTVGGTHEVKVTQRIPCAVSSLPQWQVTLDSLKIGDLLAILSSILKAPVRPIKS
jgi:hypothetical protein